MIVSVIRWLLHLHPHPPHASYDVLRGQLHRQLPCLDIHPFHALPTHVESRLLFVLSAQTDKPLLVETRSVHLLRPCTDYQARCAPMIRGTCFWRASARSTVDWPGVQCIGAARELPMTIHIKCWSTPLDVTARKSSGCAAAKANIAYDYFLQHRSRWHAFQFFFQKARHGKAALVHSTLTNNAATWLCRFSMLKE